MNIPFQPVVVSKDINIYRTGVDSETVAKDRRLMKIEKIEGDIATCIIETKDQNFTVIKKISEITLAPNNNPFKKGDKVRNKFNGFRWKVLEANEWGVKVNPEGAFVTYDCFDLIPGTPPVQNLTNQAQEELIAKLEVVEEKLIAKSKSNFKVGDLIHCNDSGVIRKIIQINEDGSYSTKYYNSKNNLIVPVDKDNAFPVCEGNPFKVDDNVEVKDSATPGLSRKVKEICPLGIKFEHGNYWYSHTNYKLTNSHSIKPKFKKGDVVNVINGDLIKVVQDVEIENGAITYITKSLGSDRSSLLTYQESKLEPAEKGNPFKAGDVIKNKSEFKFNEAGTKATVVEANEYGVRIRSDGNFFRWCRFELAITAETQAKFCVGDIVFLKDNCYAWEVREIKKAKTANELPKYDLSSNGSVRWEREDALNIMPKGNPFTVNDLLTTSFCNYEVTGEHRPDKVDEVSVYINARRFIWTIFQKVAKFKVGDKVYIPSNKNDDLLEIVKVIDPDNKKEFDYKYDCNICGETTNICSVEESKLEHVPGNNIHKVGDIVTWTDAYQHTYTYKVREVFEYGIRVVNGTIRWYRWNAFQSKSNAKFKEGDVVSSKAGCLLTIRRVIPTNDSRHYKYEASFYHHQDDRILNEDELQLAPEGNPFKVGQVVVAHNGYRAEIVNADQYGIIVKDNIHWYRWDSYRTFKKGDKVNPLHDKYFYTVQECYFSNGKEYVNVEEGTHWNAENLTRCKDGNPYNVGDRVYFRDDKDANNVYTVHEANIWGVKVHGLTPWIRWGCLEVKGLVVVYKNPNNSAIGYQMQQEVMQIDSQEGDYYHCLPLYDCTEVKKDQIAKLHRDQLTEAPRENPFVVYDKVYYKNDTNKTPLKVCANNCYGIKVSSNGNWLRYDIFEKVTETFKKYDCVVYKNPEKKSYCVWRVVSCSFENDIEYADICMVAVDEPNPHVIKVNVTELKLATETENPFKVDDLVQYKNTKQMGDRIYKVLGSHSGGIRIGGNYFVYHEYFNKIEFPFKAKDLIVAKVEVDKFEKATGQELSVAPYIYTVDQVFHNGIDIAVQISKTGATLNQLANNFELAKKGHSFKVGDKIKFKKEYRVVAVYFMGTDKEVYNVEYSNDYGITINHKSYKGVLYRPEMFELYYPYNIGDKVISNKKDAKIWEVVGHKDSNIEISLLGDESKASQLVDPKDLTLIGKSDYLKVGDKVAPRKECQAFMQSISIYGEKVREVNEWGIKITGGDVGTSCWMHPTYFDKLEDNLVGKLVYVDAGKDMISPRLVYKVESIRFQNGYEMATCRAQTNSCFVEKSDFHVPHLVEIKEKTNFYVGQEVEFKTLDTNEKIFISQISDCGRMIRINNEQYWRPPVFFKEIEKFTFQPNDKVIHPTGKYILTVAYSQKDKGEELVCVAGGEVYLAKQLKKAEPNPFKAGDEVIIKEEYKSDDFFGGQVVRVYEYALEVSGFSGTLYHECFQKVTFSKKTYVIDKNPHAYFLHKVLNSRFKNNQEEILIANLDNEDGVWEMAYVYTLAPQEIKYNEYAVGDTVKFKKNVVTGKVTDVNLYGVKLEQNGLWYSWANVDWSYPRRPIAFKKGDRVITDLKCVVYTVEFISDQCATIAQGNTGLVGLPVDKLELAKNKNPFKVKDRIFVKKEYCELVKKQFPSLLTNKLTVSSTTPDAVSVHDLKLEFNYEIFRRFEENQLVYLHVPQEELNAVNDPNSFYYWRQVTGINNSAVVVIKERGAEDIVIDLNNGNHCVMITTLKDGTKLKAKPEWLMPMFDIDGNLMFNGVA